jgi:hypothetical protein
MARQTLPLLQDRELVDGQAAAYACDAPALGRGFTCQALVMESEGLKAQLASPYSRSNALG